MCTKGRPAASAIGRSTSWLDTTATSSPPRVPARQRKIRSLRQCPIFGDHHDDPRLLGPIEAESHPEFGCDGRELFGQRVDVDGVVRADERRAQEELLAGDVVELLVFGDVVMAGEQERADGMHDAGALLAAQRQGEGLGHDRIFFISGSTSGSATTVAETRRSKYWISTLGSDTRARRAARRRRSAPRRCARRLRW